MNRIITTAILSSLLISIFSCKQNSESKKNESAASPTARIEIVADSLMSPVQLLQSPGDTTSLYIVSQVGKILKIIPSKGSKELFLDLSAKVIPMDSNFAEVGLMGMVFDPEYPENQHFYAFYTFAKLATELGVKIRISKFTQQNSQELTLQSEKVILEIDHPGMYMMGGQMEFGNDGFLYIGVGSGRFDKAQDNSNLLGTILRIDVKKPDENNNYSIPADNPFIGSQNPEIYAYGLRNPYRFSRDLVTGEIFIADVGDKMNEEINILRPGANYGWPKYDGDSLTREKDLQSILVENNQFPLINLPHPEIFIFGYAITGAVNYRGQSYRDLLNGIVSADWSGALSYSVKGESGKWITKPLNIENIGNYLSAVESRVVEDTTLQMPSLSINALCQNNQGELYLLCQSSAGAYNSTGKVFKLQFY